MPTDARSGIAGEVRAEMARQGKTTRQLAAAIGLDQDSAWRRYSGRRSFKSEELAAVATWLEVPIAKLIPATEPVDEAVAS